MIDIRHLEEDVNQFANAVAGRSISVCFGNLVKRTFDLLAACIGLIVLSPFFLIIGILIKLDSEGPVFYRGLRVGKNRQLFRILKFRTMYERPESYRGPRLTAGEDGRITQLGHWLRNTKANELPQLWNVLRGEMSLVGPRPEDPELVEAYPPGLCDEILSIRPGITSPASVLYRSEQDLLIGKNLMGTYLDEVLPDKLRLDRLYVRNRSFFSDLDIIFWTLAILLPRYAKTNIPEKHLFAGHFSRFIQRYVSWFLLDLIVAFTTVSAATLAWRTQYVFNWGWGHLAVLALCWAFIFSGANYVAGFSRILWSRARAEDAIGLFFSAGLVTLVTLFLNQLQDSYHWLPFPSLPAELIVSAGVLAQFGSIVVRYRLRLVRRIAEICLAWGRNLPGVGERILIVGDGEMCQIASWLLRHGLFRHVFSTVGIVATKDFTMQGMRLGGSLILGGIGDLGTLIKKHDVRLILYAVPSSETYIKNKVFDLSRNSEVKIVFLDDLFGFIHGQPEKPTAAQEYLDWLQQRVNGSSMQDCVTGLPNGIVLQDRLQHSLARAKRYSTTPALLLVELKGIEAMTGHNVTKIEEELFRNVAKRLENFRRDSDTLSRIKSNQFALLLDDLPNAHASETILKRMRVLLSEPFVFRNYTLIIQTDVELLLPSNDLSEVNKIEYSDLANYYSRSEIPRQPLLEVRFRVTARIIQ